MEAINGWIKEELFLDFKINSCDDIFKQVEDYIHYFNYERPQAALNYLAPTQFKQFYYNKED
ncbi:MAG: IS3 family transposase, partial [Bacilli bacterium]|nr:IS3 family transposase [Bacilli bacterium]